MIHATLQEWAEAHPKGALRVARRIERFAGNTTDPETSAAAEELLDMLVDTGALKKEKS